MTKLSRPHLLQLAFRQLLQEIRAGELRILFFALLIAVTASTAIGYFSARLQASMEMRAGEFLAADLVLRGSNPATPAQRQAGLQLGLQHAETITFSTVIVGEETLQLISVKAADAHYPLRGTLKIKDQLDAPEYSISQGPAAGEIWAEQRLLLALNVNIGDTLHIGKASLKLTKVLTYEPDRSLSFYSLNPHVLMNTADINATEAIQAGSRVSYRTLWAGPLDALENYVTHVKPNLAANQQLLTPKEGNNQVNSALERGENYLNLASLVAILLASTAVALSAKQFALKRFNNSALLRCLGLSRRQVLSLYGLELFYLALIACLLGAFLGWLVQLGLFKLLAGLVKTDLPSGGLIPAIAGIITGFISLIGFALPPLAALGNTPPIRVLRQDVFPTPLRSWVVYGLAFLALSLIMWRLSLDIKLTAALMGGGLFVAILLGALLFWVLKGLRRFLTNASLAWRLGLGQLLRYPFKAISQILAFGIILMAMALIVLLRNELLATWKNQLPHNAPNYFAMNITSQELDTFKQQVTQISPHIAPYYPIVAGRLTQVKGVAVNQLKFTGSRGENATQRDLNLTWAATLPNGNRITQGQWWTDKTPHSGLIRVSLEDELAQSLAVTIGDQLTFVIAGETYQVEVTSTRKVNWDNFQPNFFVIFDPQSIHNISATFLTSFYVPQGNDQAIIELSRQFPTVTLLDVNALLDQLNRILAQVSFAVEYILLFVLAAGLTVLLAGLQSTLDDRIRQGALLRALGANKQLLVRSRRAEFALLGSLAGCLAAFSCEAISLLLYTFVLKLVWQPHPWLLLLPFIGALLIGCIGLWGTRRTVTISPMQLLREG